MEPELISADYTDFIVHFERSGNDPDYKMSWCGSATEIQKYSDGSWQYASDTSSDSTGKREEARVWFGWSFCWRGVWEGRIYFKQEEFWCEDLEAIPKLWNEIQARVKEQIKKDNPGLRVF